MVALLCTDLCTIRSERLRLKLSQTALAEISGVSQSVISHIETGVENRKTSYDVAYKLAAALGKSINEIDWPFGLTHRGRPTGTKNENEFVQLEQDIKSICPACYTVLPCNGHCDFCD